MLNNPLAAPTDASTPGGNPASSSPGLPNGVNPAQAPANPPTLPSSAAPQGSPTNGATDPSGLIANYEQRLRNMMSEKDKAINERNGVISQLTELQKQYTALQHQASDGLAGAANATQQAIDNGNRLQAENDTLKGELQRYKSLQKHPDLLPYLSFIPTRGTQEEQDKAIEELKAIREQDLQRVSQGQSPYFSNPTLGATNPAQLPPGTQPAAPLPNPLQSLYGNRPTMAPTAFGLPGSTPASMNPAGVGTTADSINKLLKDARDSGDPAKFESALEQAKTMANAAVRQQLGQA